MSLSMKIGTLVKAGWNAKSSNALASDEYQHIRIWDEVQAGTASTSSVTYDTRGIVVDIKRHMICVQWPKCMGWSYDDAVKIIQE